MEDVTAKVLSEKDCFERNTGFEKWGRTQFAIEKAKAFYRGCGARKMPVAVLENKELVERVSLLSLTKAIEVIEFYGKTYRLSVGERIVRGHIVLVIRLVKYSPLPEKDQAKSA